MEAMELVISASPYTTHWIVILYKLLYSSAVNARDEDVLTLQAKLVPIFDELDIDAVLMGSCYFLCNIAYYFYFLETEMSCENM